MEEARRLAEGQRPLPGPGEQLVGQALRVLARGLVHRLNNCLAIFSSHAQMLELEVDEAAGASRRDARALRSALERSQGAVDLIDGLLRGPERSPVCVGGSLRALASLLLLERDGVRFPIEVDAPPHVFTSAPGAPLLVACTLLVDGLVRGAPALRTVGVDLQPRDGGGGDVTIGFRRDEGELPLRIPVPQPSPELRDFARRNGISVAVHDDPGGYWLGLPASSS